MDDELKKEKKESLRKGNLKIMMPIKDKKIKDFEKNKAFIDFLSTNKPLTV